MQIFQRSFSTKGSGRGIGTYSMKLLTEQYLGGEILVESSQENGTTFTVVIPLKTDI
jgi:sensor histidine kinase regulating citrate/malate metabolism